MAMSAASLFSSRTTTASASASGVQSRAAALAQLKKTRELAAMSSLQKLGVALAGAKFQTKTMNGIVHYEDNYISVPTYKRVLSYRTDTTYENQPIYEDREATTPKTVYKTKDVMGTRPTYETRDVFEDQPVYETRDIMGTRVSGNIATAGFGDLGEGDIAVGAGFSVQVGSGQPVTVRFGANNDISVTQGASVTAFNYDGSAGSMSMALLDALGSIDGLDASFDEQGQLQLETQDAQALVIADADTDAQDGAASPLAALGLTAGITEASVIGTEQVQTGTSQIKTGQEQVQTGTEAYVASIKKVAVGIKNVVTGTQKVQIGTQKVATGTQQVVDSTTYVRTGETRKSAGSIRVQEPATSETLLSQTSHKKILAAAMSLDVAIGPATLTDGSANLLGKLRDSVDIDKLKTTDRQVDIGLATLAVTSVLKAYQKARSGSSTTSTTA